MGVVSALSTSMPREVRGEQGAGSAADGVADGTADGLAGGVDVVVSVAGSAADGVTDSMTDSVANDKPQLLGSAELLWLPVDVSQWSASWRHRSWSSRVFDPGGSRCR